MNVYLLPPTAFFRLRQLLMLCTLLGVALFSNAATTYTWTGAGDGVSFSDADNWTPSGGPPVAGDSVTFTDGVATTTAVTIGSDVSVANLTLSDVLNAITFSGAGKITITSSGTSLLVESTGNDSTIQNAISLGASQSWNIASGRALTVSGEVDAGGSGFDLTKIGGGTLILGGSNDLDRIYIGGTSTGADDLDAGTVKIGNAYSLGLGNTYIRRGTLDIAGIITAGGVDTGAIELGNYDGTASAVQAQIIDSVGTGRFSLGGSLTYNAGQGPGDILISADMDLGGANRTFAITNSPNATIELEITGDISSVLNFNITKTGTGVLKLSGSNTFGGLTIGSSSTATGGTVMLGHNEGLGVQFVTIRGSDLDLNGFNGKVLQDLTLGNTTTGPESRIIDMAGGGSITVFSNVIYTSTAGAVNGASIQTPVLLSNAVGTVFNVGDSPNVTDDLVIHGGVGGQFGLTKEGAGTLVLLGTNTYTGDTTVGGGTLRITYSADVSLLSDTDNLIFNGGILDLSGTSGHSEVVGGTILSGAGAVTRSSGASTLNLNSITINRGGTLALDFDGLATTDNLNGPGGILDRRITVDGGWAVNSLNTDDGPIVAYTGYTDVNRLGGTIADSASSNVRIIDGGVSGNVTLASAGTTTINSLVQGATAGTATIDIGAGNILRIGSGTNQGVLLGDGRGTLEFVRGTLTITNETAGALYLQNQNPTNTITIGSVIANNGSGLVRLIKDGIGDVVITNINTFTDGVIVNFGTLRAIGVSPTGAQNAVVTPTVNPLGGNLVTLTDGSTLQIRDDANGTTTSYVLNYGNNILATGNATVDVGRNTSTTTTTKTIRLGTITFNSGVDTFTTTAANTYTIQFKSPDANGTLMPGNMIFNATAGTVQFLDTAYSGTANNLTLSDGGAGYTLTKNGGGNLTLGKATIDGLITVNAGTFQLNNANNQLPAGVVLNGGTLLLNANNGVLGPGSSPDVIVNGGTVDIRPASAAQAVGLDYFGNATLSLRNNTDRVFSVESVDIADSVSSFTFDPRRPSGSGASALMVLDSPITTHGPLEFRTVDSSGNNYIGAIGGANSSFTLGGDITFNVTNTATLAISAPISDGGNGYGITKNGTNDLILQGTNTYQGVTVINRGSIVIGEAVNLGTNTLIFNRGDAADPATLVVTNTMTAPNSAWQISDMTNNNRNGAVSITAGSTLTLNNPILDGTLNGNSAGFIKLGDGTLVLNANSTFGDLFIINGGVVQLGVDQAIFAGIRTNNVYLNSGVLDLNGRTQNVAAVVLSDDAASHNSAVNPAGTGTSATITGGPGSLLVLGGTLRYDGGTNGNAGGAVITTDIDLGVTNRTVTVYTSTATNVGLRILGNISDKTDPNAVTTPNNNSHYDLTKNGAGTLFLGGSNSFDRLIIGSSTGTGADDLDAGTVIIGDPYALGDGTTYIRRGTLDIAGIITAGGVNTSGLEMGNYDGTLSGTQSQIIDSVGGGRFSLGGNVTFSSSGNNGGSFGALISADMDLGGANRTFTINDAANAAIDLEISGDISSVLNFNITKSGAGVLKLSGSNTFGGLTIGNSSTASGGTVILGNDDALGVQFVTIRGSDLDVNGSNGKVIENLTLGNTTTGPESRIIDTAGGGSITVFSNVVYTATSTAANGASIQTALQLSNAVGTVFDIGDSDLLPVDLTVSGPIGGINGLNKTGAGTLLLTGTNSFTGDTTIAGGTLQLGYLGDASMLADGGNLVFTGGTLDLAGSVAHEEIVAGTSVANLNFLTRSTGSSIIRLNSITISPESFLQISEDSIATTDNLNVNGILPGITVGGDWAANATDSADGFIVAYTGYDDVTRLSSGSKTIADNAASNVRIIEGTGSLGDISLAGSGLTAINSLLQSADGGLTTVDVGTGNTLRLGPIGFLLPAGKSSLLITGGTLTAGAADDTAETLLLQIKEAAESLDVASVIADNGTGIVGISKWGVGGLVLSGDNTFTGGLVVNEGTVRLNHAGALNSAAPNTVTLTAPGATLQLNGTSVTVSSLSGVSGAVIENANATDATLTIDQSTDTTFDGLFADGTGAGTLSVIKSGTGRLLLPGASSTFTGGLTLNEGTLAIGSQGTAGVNTGVGLGTLRLNGGTFQLDSTSGGKTVLVPVEIGGDITFGNVSVGVSDALTLSNVVTLVGGTHTITVTNDNGTATTLSGIIGDGGNDYGIIKAGPDRLVLSGIGNTFTGPITINEGTLDVTAANATWTAGTVELNSGATLRVNNNSALGSRTLTINGGTFSTTAGTSRTLANDITVGGDFTLGQESGGTGSLTLNGAVDLGGATRVITVDNSTDTLGGVISNGGITKAGTGGLVLSGTGNAFVGPITVDAGRLDATGDNSANWTSSHTVTLNSGAILRVNNNNALGGRVLTINGGTFATTSTTGRTLANDIVVGGDFTLGQVSGGTAALTLNGAVDLGGATRVITVDNSSDTIGGIISNGGLTKAGTGTLILSGANTFVGGIIIEDGILRANGASPSGTTVAPTTNPLANNTVTLKSGSTLQIRDNGDATTTAQTLTYLNDIVVDGNASISVDRLASPATTKTIRMGSLTINSGVDTLNTSAGNSYQVHFRSPTASGIALPGNFTFNVTGTTTLLNQNNSSTANDANWALTDGGMGYTLTKIGSGNLTLGKTRVDGLVTVEAGTLQLNSAGNVLPAGIVVNAGTLLVNAANGVLGAGTSPDVQVNGGTVDIRNTGGASAVGFDYLGSATLAIRNNADQTWNVESVDVAASAPDFTLNVARTSGSGTGFRQTLNSPVTTHGALQLNVTSSAGSQVARIAGGNASVTLGGNLTVNADTAPLAIDAVISDGGNGHGLTIIGTSTLSLGAANTFSGDTRLGDGVTAGIGSLVLSNASALQNSTLELAAGDTGTLGFGALSAATLGGLKGTQNLVLENGSSAAVALSVGNNGQDTTYSGSLSGAGGLIKIGAGKLTLSGANNFSGTATVSGGTLELAADAALASPGQVSIETGGTLLISGSGAVDRIGNAVPVNFNGGTLTTGDNTLNESLGTLTLSANSTLDFGNGSGVLNFADSSGESWTGGTTLLILNWTGLAASEGGTGGGTDQLIFGNASSALTGGQLSQIKFQFDWGQSDAVILSNGEVIAAVPEPATVIAVLTLLSLVGFHERRRIATLLRRVRA